MEGNCICGWLGASRRVRYDMPMMPGDSPGLSRSVKRRQAHPGKLGLRGRLGPGAVYRWRFCSVEQNMGIRRKNKVEDKGNRNALVRVSLFLA